MMFGKNVDKFYAVLQQVMVLLQCSTHPKSKQGGIHVFLFLFFCFFT